MPGDMAVTTGDMVAFPLSALQWGQEGGSPPHVKPPIQQEAW